MARKLFSFVAVALVSMAFAATAQADTVGGPKGADDSIEAYQTITYNASFYGNALARVGIIGDGDTDLDLYVYDENGNLIASDTAAGDRCYVSWVPKWTGRFIIKVVNRGSVYNDFRLRTD